MNLTIVAIYRWNWWSTKTKTIASGQWSWEHTAPQGLSMASLECGTTPMLCEGAMSSLMPRSFMPFTVSLTEQGRAVVLVIFYAWYLSFVNMKSIIYCPVIYVYSVCFPFYSNHCVVSIYLLFPRTLHKMAWRYREGFQPEEVEYYTAGNYGPDSNRTFEFSGLVVFSDASIGVLPGYEG